MKEYIFNAQTLEMTEREMTSEEIAAVLEYQHKDEIYTKISELKHKLADTDYQAIKYAEGAMTAAEYAPYKADRAKWRAEINDLEKKLQK